jgi:hypothetical protein
VLSLFQLFLVVFVVGLSSFYIWFLGKFGVIGAVATIIVALLLFLQTRTPPNGAARNPSPDQATPD